MGRGGNPHPSLRTRHRRTRNLTALWRRRYRSFDLYQDPDGNAVELKDRRRTDRVYPRRQIVPSGLSSRIIPASANSSRRRSDVAKSCRLRFRPLLDQRFNLRIVQTFLAGRRPSEPFLGILFQQAQNLRGLQLGRRFFSRITLGIVESRNFA